MNCKPDNERLLTDVLFEATPADFRDAMFGETLRLVRRRRHWRQTRRAAVSLVALGVCGIYIWQKNMPPQPVAPPPVAVAVEKNYQLVQTRPLPAAAIVVTKPLAFGQVVTSAESVSIVQTSNGNYHVIDDERLLALVGRRPAILIRTGPHSEELVFANPEDQKGFSLD